MDKELLAMLVCPLCKGKLKYRREAAELHCLFDGLAYPVRDGIPVMLPEEARRLTPEETLHESPGRTGEA
ncbi:Trm112 family protein [Halomonas sp. BM-2019]|uniref:Trm112 family protein n=1 Tax=Halomonas sp. BM-2019 TaxID=2811227 RepID=UPI001B3C25BC|nr:MAG: Trm112 family protein [Halomonas sp. BM-2019]